MERKQGSVNQGRRRLLRLSAGAVVAGAASHALNGVTATAATLAKNSTLAYPSGRSVPRVGMGTWLTFDVPSHGSAFESRQNVLKTFFEYGGGMIDSSPMYGKAERVMGDLLATFEGPVPGLFSATKIWTVVGSRGPAQLANSFELWKRNPLDLVHVHNLLRWEQHLKTLREAKERGDVRYIGLTTSHGRRHDEMERLIRTEPVDCVQFTYNVIDREAERRLLPAAQDRGVAVVINRPFQTGALFRRFARHPLPPWADDIGCDSWAAFFLRFVISHPAVTTVIPATTRADHMAQNMEAGKAVDIDAGQRQRMIDYIESL